MPMQIVAAATQLSRGIRDKAEAFLSAMKFRIVANAERAIYCAPAVFAPASKNRFRTKVENSIVRFEVCDSAHRNTAAVIPATLSAQFTGILHCSGDLQRHYDVRNVTVELWHG